MSGDNNLSIVTEFKKIKNNQWEKFVRANKDDLYNKYHFFYDNWILDANLIGLDILADQYYLHSGWQIVLRFIYKGERYTFIIVENDSPKILEMGRDELWEEVYYSGEFEIVMDKFAKDVLGIPYDMNGW